MTNHIVMFRFRDDVPEQLKRTAREAFKKGIEALPAEIPFIREVRVGFNINPAESWDICLVSRFDSLEEAKAYGAHPSHKAVAAALMEHIAQRACVDFES